MSKFLWIVGGATLALAIYAVLNGEQLGLSSAGGPTDGLGSWGTKQRVTGVGGQLKGKVEQGLGGITGDEQMSNQGAFDQATGAVRNVAGKAAQAVGGAVRDITS